MKINIRKISFKKGSGLVEILIAIFIFTVILGSLITVSGMYISTAFDSLKSTKAAYIAQEGIEAVKIIRDTGWNYISTLSENTDYYFYFDTSSSTNNTWYATSTFSYIDSIYVRTFNLEPVYRDSSGRITDSGFLDPYTKKVTVSVSYLLKNSTTNKSLSTYIANI